jgi:crossover junction endodeoxyribonuclease RuvC
MSEWIIGIDPGKSGGIAAISDTGEVASVAKLAQTERDIGQALEDMSAAAGFAYIERVSSSPQMGVKSAFTFGQSYGFLRGCLYAAGIPFEEVAPAKWQRSMGCLSKGDKNVTKAKAQQLFPGIKVTHAIADALLIAEYGRRLRGGTL